MENAKKIIAIPMFPGSNGEIDNVRTLRRCGFDTLLFRWNDSREKLVHCDGYFFGAGFSYEDRGRSGMVAARDPLFTFLHEESERGKVIIGNCNGAQVLVESGLIPMGKNVQMSLAHNAIQEKNGQWKSPGFLNEWIWMKRVCARDRCATSDWEGNMHIPIAHGEGRFVTKDKDLLAELKKNDQIAFQYCDKNGVVSEEPSITPNGSTCAIAGLCNPAGNVVAIMPHPERTLNGDAYFLSIHSWWKKQPKAIRQEKSKHTSRTWNEKVEKHQEKEEEIFIKIMITDNEERTVEQAARRITPEIHIKQYRYIAPTVMSAEKVLSTLKYFNPNKERAIVRRKGKWLEWNAAKKSLVPTEEHTMMDALTLFRKNEPEIYPKEMGEKSEVGIVYVCTNITQQELMKEDVLEVFANPHSSHLELLQP